MVPTDGYSGMQVQVSFTVEEIGSYGSLTFTLEGTPDLDIADAGFTAACEALIDHLQAAYPTATIFANRRYISQRGDALSP